MDRRVVRLLHGLLACSLTAALLPALYAQDRPNPQDNRQTSPAQAQRPQPGARPGGNRPTPTQSTGRPQHTQPQPSRPEQARPQPTPAPLERGASRSHQKFEFAAAPPVPRFRSK
jgi:hypothetical protein